MAASTSLTFLTWNLALMERSAQAPELWDLSATEAAVRERVLAGSPDVVLFQELPGLVPYIETHAMVRGNPKSHSGHLATLVTHELMAMAPTVTVVPGCALLTTFTGPALTVANVHLMPGRGRAGDRLEQMAAVVEASPTEALLIVGDTNTRTGEVEAMEAAGFHAARPHRATWDSGRNRFRVGGPRFTAYFTRWFASPPVTVTGVKVWHEPVVHGERRFHLSDHYALTGTITVGR